MQNDLLNDERTYHGEMLLLVRIAKLLTAIEMAGQHHLTEAKDWCQRRLREHAQQLSIDDFNRQTFGQSDTAKTMRDLLGSHWDDRQARNIQAAVFAVQECSKHRLIIDELQNYCRYYNVAEEPPIHVPMSKKFRHWKQGAA